MSVPSTTEVATTCAPTPPTRSTAPVGRAMSSSPTEKPVDKKIQVDQTDPLQSV